jgi:pimeloyl-ACP methyl ester carboxylesterase
MSKKMFILPGLNGDALFLDDFKRSLEKAALEFTSNNHSNFIAGIEGENQKVKLENIHSGIKRSIPIDDIEDVQVNSESQKNKEHDINFVLVDEPVAHEQNNVSNVNISMPYLHSEWDIEIIEYPKNQILTYAELQEYVFQRVMEYDEFFILAESFSGPIAASLASLCADNIKGIIFAASFVETPLLFSKIASKAFNKIPYIHHLHKMPFNVVRHLLINNYHDEVIEEKIREFLSTAKEEVIYSRIKEVINLNHNFLNTYNDIYASFNSKILSIVAGNDALLSKLANFPLPVFDEKMIKNTHFSYKIANRLPQTQIAFFNNAPHMILELYPDRMAKEVMGWIYHNT